MDMTIKGAGMRTPIPSTPRLSQQPGAVSGGSPKDVPSAEPSVDRQAVEAVAAELQDLAKSRNVSLSFSTYGKEGDKISVTVSDKETGEVIREIPPEELQRLSGKLEEMVGMVFDGRV
ncbi:MAG: flagellar protein FlaG [Deltaproteobacteria bacterium]|nr:flagellar protein FlaG [Deltaproteobacteria bacterium]